MAGPPLPESREFERMTMKLRSLGASRRSLVIAAAAVATVISLGIGANAALNKITSDARQAVFNVSASRW
jgi:hypothetical protein